MKDIDTTGPTENTQSRRRVMNMLGAGAAAVVGLGSFAGSAAAWERNDVDFKGCSEVWIIVAKEDVLYKPPTVAKVIVETSHGDLDCRAIEFTPETTTTIPGRYGDAPVYKYPADSGEKVLGVIIYNYTDDEENPFKRDESPLRVNPNRCANTPGTPDPFEAPCVTDNTFDKPEDILDGNQGSNGNKKDSKGKDGKGKDSKGKDGNGNGNNKKGNNGKSGKGKANGHNSE